MKRKTGQVSVHIYLCIVTTDVSKQKKNDKSRKNTN